MKDENSKRGKSIDERELLEILMENIPDTIYFKDTSGRFIKINHAQELVLGVKSPSGALGKTDLDFFDPAHAKNAYKDEQKIVRTGRPIVSKVERIRRADGQYRWVTATKVPIKNDKGKVTGIVGISRDITEHKKVDDALQKERDFIAAVLDVTSFLVVVLDREGRIVRWNKACERMTGYSFEEVKDLHALELFILPEELSTMKGYFQKILDGHFPSAQESYWRTKYGNCRLISWSNNALLNDQGEVEYIIATGLDVTRQRLSAKAIEKSEKYFRSLFEESKDAIFISTPEGKIIDVNPAAVGLFGYDSKEEFLSMDAKGLYIDVEDREYLKELFNKYGTIDNLDTVMRKKDGSEFSTLLSGYAVYDEQGKISEYRGIVRDISERKRLENERLQLKKMESIEKLAGRFAHEFNNILCGIQGYITYLKLKMDKKKTLYNHVVKMEKALKKASGLIENLLILSYDDSLIGNSIDLNSIVNAVHANMAGAQKKSLHVETSLSNPLPLIHANPEMLEKILMHLVTNALEAMPNGGTIRIETKSVQNRSEEPGMRNRRALYVALSVTDTGVGMDEYTVERVFEPFYSTKKIKDAGLGLWYVYNAVNKWGGSIMVRSQPGQGSTFTIYFPIFGNT